jgi:hypothetical protein
VRGAGVFELVTSPLLSPAGAGSEVELKLTGPPTTDTGGDQTDDVTPMAGCRFLDHLDEVVIDEIRVNGA